MASTKPPINWRTYLLCVTISLGQLVGAYNSVIIGTTLQKADFMQRMGLWDGEGNSLPNSSAREGAIVGLFQVLQASLRNSSAAYRMNRQGQYSAI